MQISKKTLRFVSKPDKKYIIPFFQRAYVWGEEEWKDLLSTLLESEDGNHFLGSMIFKEDGDNSKAQGVKIYNVIDGQQIFTTLLILLKVCLEKINENFCGKDKYNKCKERINKTIYFYKDEDDVPTEKSDIKLVHSMLDANVFEKVINNKELTKEDKISNIYKCYEYFSAEKVEDDRIIVNQSTAMKLIDIILKDDSEIDNDKDNLDYLFITIDLTSKESEQVIFNTINAQGVQLSSADKIKNIIYSKFKKSKDAGKKYFNTTWAQIFENDTKTIKFWNKTVGTGVQAKTNIDLVLQYVATNLGFYTPDKTKNKDLNKLSNYYEDFIGKKSIEEIKKLINIVMKYAIIYRELFEDIDIIDSFNNDIKRIAHIVYNSGAMTICPYLIKIFYDASNITDDDYTNIGYSLPATRDIKNQIKQLESLIIRFVLISDNNSKIKNFNKKVAPIIRDNKKNVNFIKNIVKDEKGNNAKIDDKNLQKGIGYIKNNKYAKLALYWITMYLDRKKKDRKLSPITYNCSLEHVMPQNYEKNYSLDKYPVIKNKKENYDEKDGREIREKAIYSLGNMTICMKAANSAYSDAYIKDKIDGNINTKQGSKYTDNEFIEITKDIIDTYKENKKNKRCGALWDERDIEKRESLLYKKIIEIWPNPLK